MSTNMRDSNWQSGRQSILKKYDKNGDGVYDTEEVNAIVDDYMTTIKNNNALIDTTQGQKKLLIFSAVMIFILSLSNLGTAFLAANLAKDVRVSDNGALMSTATGEEVKAIAYNGQSLRLMAQNVKALTHNHSVFRKLQRLDDADRELLEVDGLESGTFHTCVSVDLVEKIYADMIEGNPVSITLADEDGDEAEATVHFSGPFERSYYTGLIEESTPQDLNVPTMLYVFNTDQLIFAFAPSAECARRRLLPGSLKANMAMMSLRSLS